MDKYYTLFDVMPELNKKEFSREIEQAKENLVENGRTDCIGDEILFIALLSHYKNVFDKASSMIAHNKFTVRYAGNKMSPELKISDFCIIPNE